MSTVPLPGGLVTVIAVSEMAVIAALTPPKSTSVAPVKPLPLIVTLSPPAAAPLAGEIPVTCGGGAGVAVMVSGPEIPGPVGLALTVSGPEISGLGAAGGVPEPEVPGPCGPGIPFALLDPSAGDGHGGARVSPPTPWVGQSAPLPPAAMLLASALWPHPAPATARSTTAATARIVDIGRPACQAPASSMHRRVQSISLPPPDPQENSHEPILCLYMGRD